MNSMAACTYSCFFLSVKSIDHLNPIRVALNETMPATFSPLVKVTSAPSSLNLGKNTLEGLILLVSSPPPFEHHPYIVLQNRRRRWRLEHLKALLSFVLFVSSISILIYRVVS